MKHGALEPLSPEMESLLGKERRFPPESAELRARVMARASAAFRATNDGLVTSFWRRRASILVAAALVTAVGAAAIAAWRGLPRPDEHRPDVAPPASGAHEASARALQSPVAAHEPSRPRETSAPESAGSARGSVVATPRLSGASDARDAYALELGLLQRARAAVASGKFAAALEVIAEHQRRFSSGRLREEREALRVNALAGLGRKDEARIAAQRFRERFPQSVLSSQMEETTRPDP